MKKLSFILFVSLFVISCGTSKIALKSVGAEVLFSGKIESGSVVKLEAKTYNLPAHILISGKENITIDGNGATLVMQSLAEDVILVENSKQIVLKNFKATHIEPEGPIGCTGNVIHVEGGSDILIEKCELNGSGIVGVAAYRTENLRIINNFIHKNSQYGIICILYKDNCQLNILYI